MHSTQSIFSSLIQKAGDDIIRALAATPDDKANWKPESAGRSILEITIECAGVNSFMARCITSGVAPAINREDGEKLAKELTNLSKAADALKSSIDALTLAVSSLPNEKLDSSITLPFLGGITTTLEEMLGRPYWHMSYHLGQINYIQTLYGDKMMH